MVIVELILYISYDIDTNEGQNKIVSALGKNQINGKEVTACFGK